MPILWNMLQWEEFMNIGAQVPDEVLDQRIGQLAPNKCCTLIYTVICLCCLCHHNIFPVTDIVISVVQCFSTGVQQNLRVLPVVSEGFAGPPVLSKKN